jgi:hypothetical protein
LPLTVASLFDGRKKPEIKSLPEQGNLRHLLRNLIAFRRFDELKTAALF